MTVADLQCTGTLFSEILNLYKTNKREKQRCLQLLFTICSGGPPGWTDSSYTRTSSGWTVFDSRVSRPWSLENLRNFYQAGLGTN